MKQLTYILIGLFFGSCSTNHDNHKLDGENLFQLPDSLFLFKDLKNSLVVNNFYWDPIDHFSIYPDSTKDKAYTSLDSVQQLKLIVPIMKKEMKVEADYVVHFMNSKFISKQKNVGDHTPIIVWVSGDDYGALFYILLDKSLTPISHIILQGGFCAGPSEKDSLIEFCENKQSIIKENEITSYVVTEFVKTSSINGTSIVDSIIYTSKILSTGKIETRRRDSTHFERQSKL